MGMSRLAVMCLGGSGGDARRGGRMAGAEFAGDGWVVEGRAPAGCALDSGSRAGRLPRTRHWGGGCRGCHGGFYVAARAGTRATVSGGGDYWRIGGNDTGRRAVVEPGCC